MVCPTMTWRLDHLTFRCEPGGAELGEPEPTLRTARMHRRGLEIEPLDINMRISLAAAYHYLGRIDEAHELAKSTYELEPTHVLARWIIAQTYTEKGMYADAIAVDEQWLQSDPRNQFALRDAGVAYARSGQRGKAENIIDRYRELAKGQYVARCRIAIIYGALGELDKAFEELDTAIEGRDWELHRMKVDKYWTPLQNDPRFKERIKRLNLPE